MMFHLTIDGTVEFCANGDSCQARSGHFPTPEAAVVQRIILAQEGRLTH